MDKPNEFEMSKKSVACQENGRKGGIKTAQRATKEFLTYRAKLGGNTLVQMYSSDYFRHVNQQRRTRKGWPLGKLRKATNKVQDQIDKANLTPVASKALTEMLEHVQR